MTRDPRPAHSPPHFGTITTIKYQQRDKLRASIFIDGIFSFGVHVQSIEHFRLRKGDEIDSILYEKIQAFDKTIAARRIAQKFLNTRRRSERDVRRKLKEKEIPEEVIETTVEEMKTSGLIDDAAYAQAFIHDRLLTKSLSAAKLALELQAKGIGREIAREAVGALTNTDDEIERALTAVTKKLPGIERKTSDPYQRSQKLYAFLAGRGFSTSTIKKTLERLGQEVGVETDV